MRKGLWILNHYAISPDMSGGTRHFDLARELVKKGHDVTIFASGFDHSTRKYVKIKPEEKMKVEAYDGVRFVWINTFPYSGNNWRRVVNMISYGWRVLRCNWGLPKPDADLPRFDGHPVSWRYNLKGEGVSNAEGKANVFFRSSWLEAAKLVKESKRFAARISRDLGVSIESLKY